MLNRIATSWLRPLFAVTAFCGAVAMQADAHGPVRQKVVETVTIAAPPSVVWARIKNFDALKDWHPAVAASPADKGNEVGSARRVDLKAGGTVIETLERYDEPTMRYSYRGKDGGALPVTNYTSTLSVSGEGNVSTVEWRGAFYRAYPNNDPPPDKNDEVAIKAITQVYQTGLANLKRQIEGH